MKRLYFRKILIPYLIIAPILIILLNTYLSDITKRNYIAKLTESLLIQSRLITDKLPLSLKGNLDNFCIRLKEETGSRITIIDNSGRVIGDSDEVSERMENHLDRPEIQQAAVSGTGSSIRFSSTLKKDFFYFARALNGKGFLRLAAPLHDLEESISAMKMQIMLASGITLIAAILIGLFQTKRITNNIEEITKFSNEIKSGNLKARLFLKEKGEISELARNINEMADALKQIIEHNKKASYKIEEILKSMSDGLMLVGADSTILLNNPAIKKIFNITSDIEGKTIMEALRSADITDILNQALTSRKTISHEVELRYPKDICLMVNAVPFYYPPDSKNISGAVLTIHDITRLKRLEDMRRDFVANVSHEIKTPITAIKGFAETLLQGAIDDRENALKFLNTIKNHSERLNSLVEDLLTLSRIEFGDIKIEKNKVNLNDAVDTVFTTLKDKALMKGINLIKEIPEDLNYITADRNRLIQILLNLVDNGIKFTEKGSVTLTASKGPSKKSAAAEISELVPYDSESEDVIEISVEDTGIGIPKRHLQRLGERFYRVDRSRSRELGGTGLGLAIVKHLVKAQGWGMNIESTPGRGTKVSILISDAS